jgi:hypothetical protein
MLGVRPRRRNRSNAANNITGKLERGNDTMGMDGLAQSGLRKLLPTVMRHLIKLQLSFLKYRKQTIDIESDMAAP